MSARTDALQALIVKHLADWTSAAIKQQRAALAEEMANGDRITVASPEEPNLKLGLVYRTEPKATAAVTDRAAFTAWMAHHYTDHVETIPQIAAGRWDEAVAVLREHAPDLLVEHTLVPGWAENEVLELTRRAKQACGPGGELDVTGVAYEPPGAGVVTVKLSEDGPAHIEELWRDGLIELNGTVKALPSWARDTS